MVEIILPAPYITVEDLAVRWQCTVRTIQVLAEAGYLELFIRPVALEIALEEHALNLSPQHKNNFIHQPLNKKDIYKLFSDKETKIPITIFLPTSKITINISFNDIIIHEEDIDIFESSHRVLPDNEIIKIMQSDFSDIILRGKEYTFGETQAKIIKLLYYAREQGTPWQYGKVLLVQSGSSSERIQNIFSGKTGWRDVILSDRKGRFKLNLPPRQSQMQLF